MTEAEMPTIYDMGLDRNPANHAPLTPLGFLERAAAVYPTRIAVAHGDLKRSYAELAERCARLASALKAAGVKRGDTVAMLAPNTPEAVEAHFAVAMAGGVLNMINIRLEARTIGFILSHGEAKVLLLDSEFGAVARDALHSSGAKPLLVEIEDAQGPGGERIGGIDYEAFLAGGDPAFPILPPNDEWDAIALNYTSGTTGDPKGVVYHHRGAYLNSIGNALAWGLGPHPVYLWVLPMFHCNGWCFPWTITAVAGTQVCLRRPDAAAIFAAIERHGVTHTCGAPVIMTMMISAAERVRFNPGRVIQMMTAGAPPPAAVLSAVEGLGFRVTHTYGLTECYGPAVVCSWPPEWDGLSAEERAVLKSRQGVRYHVLEDLAVKNAETLVDVPRDGVAMGEVMMRGNVVMKGYLKNPSATQAAFAGGWFRTGDLAVRHPNGYIELKDRSKDIIISGGENISTIEVESVLYQHAIVLEAAVVARPDPLWGEVPCAFVTLKPGAEPDAESILAHCRENLAKFKVPKAIIFGPLPKTSTGKIQKFALRERAKVAP